MSSSIEKATSSLLRRTLVYQPIGLWGAILRKLAFMYVIWASVVSFGTFPWYMFMWYEELKGAKTWCCNTVVWLSEGAFDQKVMKSVFFCRPSVISEETVILKRGGYCFERQMVQISFHWCDDWDENIGLNDIFCDVIWYKFYTTVVMIGMRTVGWIIFSVI